jgi:TrmH family RNA methyltransferase
MIITSNQNPKIKHLVGLQGKNYRSKNKEFIAQGFKTCKTLVDSGFTLKSIFMTERMYLEHQNNFLINETYVVDDTIMQRISTTATPTGIVGIFEMKNEKLIATNDGAVLVNIQDPGNLGTLIRSACAMGLHALYLIDCVDFYNPKVIQASTGSILNLKILICTWNEFKDTIQSIPLCALVVESGQTPSNIDLKDSLIVIGNEGQGLSEAIIKQCTTRMTIPMPGKTESLNAAVAGSIAMYLKSQANIK